MFIYCDLLGKVDFFLFNKQALIIGTLLNIFQIPQQASTDAVLYESKFHHFGHTNQTIMHP